MTKLGKYSRAIALAISVSAASVLSAPQSAQADEIEKMKQTFDQAYQKGKFRVSIGTMHKLAEVVKAKHGAGHERHIKMLDRLANQYLIVGKKSITEKILLGALKLAEAKHGKESKPALRTRSSLGVLYVGQGRKADAKVQFEAAAAIAEKVYGADDLETRVMKNNLAWVSK